MAAANRHQINDLWALAQAWHVCPRPKIRLRRFVMTPQSIDCTLMGVEGEMAKPKNGYR